MAAPDHISSLLNVRIDSLRSEFEFQLFIKKYMVKLGELYTIYGKILSKLTTVRSPISYSFFVCLQGGGYNIFHQEVGGFCSIPLNLGILMTPV